MYWLISSEKLIENKFTQLLFSADTMVSVGNYIKKIEAIFLIIFDVWYLYMDQSII